MIRKRKLFIIAVVVIVGFLLTTNYLLFLLNSNYPQEKSEVSFTIEEQIYSELRRLPEHYKRRSLLQENQTDIYIKNINTVQNNQKSFGGLWKEANLGVNKSQLYDITEPSLGTILNALKIATITKADVDPRGTQLKFLLTLEGNQRAVFKPKWYENDKIIEGPVYAGKDRYFSEIIGFYLSILINKPLTPLCVERTISLRHEIVPVATTRLLNTAFGYKNRTCIYGKCFYCKKEDPICEDANFNVKGAVIFNFKAALRSFRSPWQRTYKKDKKAVWENNEPNFCRKLRHKLTKRRIYDLIDTAIFDFLLQNGDRHHYETIGDTVILLDNGKGLGNPFVHHIDILAPLYQCCILRRETWKSLLRLTGGALTEKMQMMPDVKNLLTDAHLKAMEERLLLVFATIEYCQKVKRDDHIYFEKYT